jgi:hypothetical protein
MILVQIAVRDGEDWTVVWTGQLPYIPQIGSTFEIRDVVGQSARFLHLHVLGVSSVLWADGDVGSVTVFTEPVDIAALVAGVGRGA